jgi:predicted small secreted protein
MMKSSKLSTTVGTAFVLSALLAALPGCQKQEGPGEQMGRGVDRATERAGEQVEKAGEKIQDAAQGDK